MDPLYVGSNHGTSTMHVGTTPGTAGPTDMSGRATLQPGAFQAGSFQPRRRVNQTIGPLTNHSVPRTTIMRRLKTGGDKYIQKGQFVFTRSGPAPNGQGGRGSEGIETLYNLPLLNFYLAHLCIHQPVEWGQKSAAAIATEFVPHGVVLNAIGNDASDTQERLVVSTVRGFVDTFNMWGNKVFGGDSLYFVYKKVKITSINPPSYSFDFSGTDAQPSVVPPAGEMLIWQVEAVACQGDSEPSIADLTDGGVPGGAPHADGCSGVARCVGRVQHARNSNGAQILGGRAPMHNCSRNLRSLTNVNQLTVFLDL